MKSLDVDLPRRKITALCGVSGSGKSSLAYDVLYAEGRRRYVECLAPSARQRLESLEKPEVDSIDGLPPALGVLSQSTRVPSTATVGGVTETIDYLRALFASLGVPRCRICGDRLRKYSPQSTAELLRSAPAGSRALIAFAPSRSSVDAGFTAFKKAWLEKGFFKIVASDETFDLRENVFSAWDFNVVKLLYDASANGSNEEMLDELGMRRSSNALASEMETDANDESEADELLELAASSRVRMLDVDDDAALARKLEKLNAADVDYCLPPVFFTVDRVVLGKTSENRIVESLETAFYHGDSRCWVFIEGDVELEERDEDESVSRSRGVSRTVDGVKYTLFGFSRSLRCEECGVNFPEVDESLFNPNGAKGACPVCLGAGYWNAFDLNRVVPNKSRSIAEGAIAPWNNSTYRSKLSELIGLSEQLGVRVDVPFSELTRAELAALFNGSRALNYKGLNGFFWNLFGQKYKMHIRVFLNKWQVQRECPLCKGARLSKDALAVTINGKNISELGAMSVDRLYDEIESWKLGEYRTRVAEFALKSVKARLRYLRRVGLGYLALERPVKTLSSGEFRRVKLTSALGSDIVDALYVLDEPSLGLHPQDSRRLLDCVRDLRDRGNTVVVVDHDQTILEGADRLVELGPGAGTEGGSVVYEGDVAGIKKNNDSLTGGYLSGRRLRAARRPRPVPRPW